jgi:hypothetical protein
MKTLTITALMAALVAIPLIVHRHRVQAAAGREGNPVPDDPRRYDIFDFVS